MKVGVAIEGIRPAAAAGDLAATVERLGFDSIWTADHLAFSQPILDPFAVLAIYASRTRQIEIGTGVFLLPLRHPMLVAKQAASLDWMSGGRFVLGIGVGGEFPAEFAAAEVPLAERGARANEAIPILRSLWSGTTPPAEGRFFRVPATRIDPAPIRPGGLPIWVGGRSDAALRRAARLADGYFGYFLDAKGFRQRMTTIRAQREAPIAAALMAFARVEDRRDRALEQASARIAALYGPASAPAAERFGVVGTPEDCAARIAELRAAGVEHLVFSPIATADEYEEQLGRLAKLAERARPS